MCMFCCGNWFQNQKQGNHQNLGSTKRKLSRKTFPHIPFSTATILDGRSLGNGISAGKPGPGLEALGTTCLQPCQNGPDPLTFSAEPKHWAQRMSTFKNEKLLDALFNTGLNQQCVYRDFKRETKSRSNLAD